MEISEGIEIADLGIYLPREKILVFSDFHIGYEESLNKQGIFIPRHQFEDTKRRLENLFSKIKDVETIIITGDLKHEFGTISGQEWREVFAIIDLMQKHCKKLVILKGNHDVVLQSMLRKKNLEVRNDYCIGDYAILHGDELPQDASVLKRKTFIIGHAHPAVKLTDSFTSEKVKCFIKGRWSGKTLIVLPSFNLVTEGTDLLSERVLSPFLQKNLDDFEIWAVAGSEKTFYFGKLRNLTKFI